MSNYFQVELDNISSIAIGYEAVNLGDENLYFKLNFPAGYQLAPSQMIRVMVAPSGHAYTDAQLSGLLVNTNTKDNPSSGLYFQKQINNTTSNKYISIPNIKIADYTWENTRFHLYYLNVLGNSTEFSGVLSGVFSHPHNIQPHEVYLSGHLVGGSNENIQYNVVFANITNEDSLSYSGITNDPADGPYWARIDYAFEPYSTTNDPIDIVSGTPIGTGTYFGAGQAASGITFTVPFYDPRVEARTVPTAYNLYINNNSAGSDKPGSNKLTIPLSHASFLKDGQYFKDLDSQVATKVTRENIKKVGEIYIEDGVIDRRRVSVRVEDVAIRENTYKTRGTFVSNPENLDYTIYTFMLQVDDVVPHYDGVNPIDVIKYYVEFNNRQWERISPLNREIEYQEGGVIIPKMFVFDRSSPEAAQGTMKFLDYDSTVNSYRIKIDFDVTMVNSAMFAPPEVRSYKAVIFDKNQFLDL